METLKELIIQQKRDACERRVYYKKENITLIRPHVYRFYDFAGDTLQQQAFSVLKYFGWNNKDIISALNITLSDLLNMESILGTTYNEELKEKFFFSLPAKTPRDKAILILRGLKWKQKDIATALNIPRFIIAKNKRLSHMHKR
jgi:hypothetical protein